MKRYLSPTQINTYLSCGERYRRRYIEGEKIPPAIALLKGSAVHKGAEVNFKQKIKSQVDLSKRDVVDYSVAHFEERLSQEGIWLNEEEERSGKTKVVGQGKDATARLAGLYASDVAPRYLPKEVESEQVIELPNELYDLKGVLDLVDSHGRIVDLKTGSRSRTQEQIDKDVQFGFYALLHRAKTGQDPKSIVIEQLLDGKTTPRNVPMETKRTTQDYEPLVRKVNAVINGIQQGVFLPAGEGWWGCSPLYCGYYSSCPFVRKR